MQTFASAQMEPIYSVMTPQFQIKMGPTAIIVISNCASSSTPHPPRQSIGDTAEFQISIASRLASLFSLESPISHLFGCGSDYLLRLFGNFVAKPEKVKQHQMAQRPKSDKVVHKIHFVSLNQFKSKGRIVCIKLEQQRQVADVCNELKGSEQREWRWSEPFLSFGNICNIQQEASPSHSCSWNFSIL